MKKSSQEGVKQALNIFMPAEFHENLKSFLFYHGLKHESMNRFFIRAAQDELDLRQAELGLTTIPDAVLAERIARLEALRGKK